MVVGQVVCPELQIERAVEVKVQAAEEVNQLQVPDVPVDLHRGHFGGYGRKQFSRYFP